MFFFTNWEFQRPRVFDNLVRLTVPTLEERRGDFSKSASNGRPVTIRDPLTNAPFSGNQIPQNRWNPYGLQLMNVFPAPNVLGVDSGYNYQYQFSGSDRRNDETVRIDYNISDRFKFFFRWLHNRRDLLQSGGLNTNNTVGIGAFHAASGAISGAGNLTIIITPTLTNDFNYGNTRNWLPNEPDPKSGYLREDYTIAMVERIGFKLVGTSEANANPKDTKDYSAGVWTLPPTRQSSDGQNKPSPAGFDRAKYDAIGESDRMTLRFRKAA